MTPDPLPQVEVLLATFNGERFLAEQVESILQQTYANVYVLARDDGSSDRTPQLLATYAAQYPHRFRVLPSDTPTGSPRDNFALLLRASTAGYICMADQDDVWLPEKISRSMLAMQQLEAKHIADTPLLVFSDLRVVDDRLRTLHESYWAHEKMNPQYAHNFAALLAQNVVAGCTATINRPLVLLAQSMPAGSYMHDYWIALIACAMGATCILPQPTVLYRQHTSNVLGAPPQQRRNWLRFNLRNHLKRSRCWAVNARLARALQREFAGRLPAPAARTLEQFIRCDTHPNRLVRVFTLLRNRFLVNRLMRNLATLWYLWDLRAARRAGH